MTASLSRLAFSVLQLSSHETLKHSKDPSQSNHSEIAFTQEIHNVSFSPFPSELPFEREEFGDKLLQFPICLNYKHLKKTPFSLRKSGEKTLREEMLSVGYDLG